VSYADDIVRLGEEHRTRAARIRTELEDLRNRNAEAVAQIAERFRQRAEQKTPTQTVEKTAQDDDESYYRPKTWLV